MSQAGGGVPLTAGDDSLTALTLGQVAAPLNLWPRWVPDNPRPIVSDSVIYDSGAPLPDRPGGMLLLVGGRPGDPDTQRAITEAGRIGYAGVVVKARGDDLAGVERSAEAASIALLVADDDTEWRDVDRLVSALVDAQDVRAPAYAAVRPGDLFALANAIAFNVGGATAIEDPNGRLFAHSNLPHQQIDEIRRNSITNRVTPTYEGDTDRYLQVRNAEHPVRFKKDKPEQASRVGMPVRAGGELLGLLWALDGNPKLGDGAEQALEDAAAVAALHLLRARQQENGERWRRGEALASLLSGRISSGVASTLIGIPVATKCTVLAIAARAPEDPAELGVARTIDLVNLYCQAWHPSALATTVDDVILALLPSSGGPERRVGLAAFARDIAATVHRTNAMTLRIGIGPPAAGLDQVVTSRRLAELTLAAMDDAPTAAAVATMEELRSRVVLDQLATHGVLDLSLPGNPLQALLDHDRDKRSGYAESLLAYLDAFGDSAAAARTLTIHENTLRYRIRRVQELFGIDLADPNSRLVIWLELRLAGL